MSVSTLRSERGAAAVELALVLPILILLLFGIVELGRGYNAKITLTHAAREGARALAVGGDAADVVARVESAMGPLTISDPATQITFSSPCTPGAPADVTVTYDIDYSIPLLPDGTFNLSSTGSMRCGG